MPRFFKRLFKFPQMDFEMAIWEMTSLIIAPKKVFRSIYYHVSHSALLFGLPIFRTRLADTKQKRTSLSGCTHTLPIAVPTDPL